MQQQKCLWCICNRISVNLLFGVDPTTVKFDVGKMRSHLYSCLQSGKFEHPFSKVEEKHEHGLPNNLVIEIPVYCVCRMPYFEDDDEVREFHMADCDHCHQWYHRSCVGVPDYVFKQNKFSFVLSVEILYGKMF